MLLFRSEPNQYIQSHNEPHVEPPRRLVGWIMVFDGGVWKKHPTRGYPYPFIFEQLLENPGPCGMNVKRAIFLEFFPEFQERKKRKRHQFVLARQAQAMITLWRERKNNADEDSIMFFPPSIEVVWGRLIQLKWWGKVCVGWRAINEMESIARGAR